MGSIEIALFNERRHTIGFSHRYSSFMLKSAPEFDHFVQDSEMVTMLRNTDWSLTPLGPPATWPEALRLQLNICFESAFPIAVWWGPDLIQFYNDGYRPILGATKHPHAFGQPAIETWPDIWPTIGPLVEQVVQQGVAVKGEDMPLVLERNGYPELCHFTFSYSPIRNIRGHIDGMFTAAVETSERVRAERRQAFQLTLADELRGLSDTDDIIATATGLLCTHLQVARAYYAEIDDSTATFNIPLQWTESPDLPQLPARGSIDEFGPYLLTTLRQGQPIVIDDMRTDPNFTAFIEPYEALAIRSIVIIPLIRDGRLRGTLNIAHISARMCTAEDLVVITDVAERTWEALERARAEDALRTSNRLKDEFLAMLAHELRNPLAPILTAAEMLRIVAHADPRVTKASEVISRQAKHMTALVDDLLDTSRVTRRLVELDKELVSLRSVIDNAIEQTKPLIESRRHQLRIQDNAPSQMLIGDRKRLVQIFANILNNAAKYTPEGGVITCSISAEEGQIHVRTSDTGVGIKESLLPHIFDLFTQAERTPDRSQGGLGIGLALVKSMVSLHGGEITASSAGIGKGSVFTVLLPMARYDLADKGRC
jgi:signal transduction histidine kinase